MRRAGALLVAVAMVVGAFLVRERGAGDDTGGTRSGPELLCPTDLAPVCRQAGVDVRAEPAGETADRLVGASTADELGADAWIVPAPWARLVVDERIRLGAAPVFEISDVIATASVVRVAWADVAARLPAACGATALDWRCVAQQAAARAVRPGGPPIDSAAGLPVAAAQVASLLDRSDYATNDFDAELRSRAAALAAGQTDDPLTTMRTRGPGELGVIAVLASQVGNLSSNFGTLEAVEEPVRADLVALVATGEDHDVASGLEAALLASGWEPPTGGPDGLPADGSVLAAVRTLWKENQP